MSVFEVLKTAGCSVNKGCAANLPDTAETGRFRLGKKVGFWLNNRERTEKEQRNIRQIQHSKKNKSNVKETRELDELDSLKKEND